jgi:predicted transcriptional regulator
LRNKKGIAMSNKEMALEAVRSLPDDAKWGDIIEHLHILAAIREGQDDIEAGRFISHEEMKNLVASWHTK